MKQTTPKLEEQENVYEFSATSMVATSTPVKYLPVQTPEVKYTPLAWNKIQYLVDICEKEVGWFGTVQEIDTGYLITDIFVPKQIVTGAETDIKAEDLADLVDVVQDPDQLYYWGHSHVNMGVSPSAQDEKQLMTYMNHVDTFIRGIYNKKGDSKVDVVQLDMMTVHQSVRDTVQVPELSTEDIKGLTEQLKNVKERVPVQTYHQRNQSYYNYGKGYNKGYNKTGANTGANTGSKTAKEIADKYDLQDQLDLQEYENPFLQA